MTFWRAFTRSFLLLALLAPAGCDLAEKAKDAVVQDHRAKARGRVGVFRALETKDRAVGVANAVRDYADPACALPKAPFTAEVRIEGTAEVAGGRHRFLETRTVRMTSAGDAFVRYHVTWVDAAARGDKWTREETVVGSKRYVREQNLPAVAHARRPDSARRVILRALDGVRTGLHAGRGRWAGGTQTWELGEAGLHAFRGCLDPSSRGWMQRLEGAAELSAAKADVTPTRRWFRGTWDLEEERQMTLDITEDIREGADPVTAPEHVADVRRDRPYRDIERILGDRLGLSDAMGGARPQAPAGEGKPEKP